MEEGEKQKHNVAGVLHKEVKLQSLRTYQGDVAEAIKSQNESVATIATKEQERKREFFAKPRQNIPINFFVLILAVFLIAGSTSALLYLLGAFTGEQAPEINIETDIIPYNTSVVLSNITAENLALEMNKVSLDGGVALVKLSGVSGNNVNNVQDFLKILKAEVPATLVRNLSGEFMLGLHMPTSGDKHPFIIVKTLGFGTTFAGMLEWEKNLPDDLIFFDTRVVSTSTPAV